MLGVREGASENAEVTSLCVVGVRGGPLELLWLALMAGAFTAGLMVGERAWRPAALLAVGTVVSILTVAAR